jgi:hypothetical protein
VTVFEVAPVPDAVPEFGALPQAEETSPTANAAAAATFEWYLTFSPLFDGRARRRLRV